MSPAAMQTRSYRLIGDTETKASAPCGYKSTRDHQGRCLRHSGPAAVARSAVNFQGNVVSQ